MDAALQVFLLPVESEVVLVAEADERDVERRDLQLVIERPGRVAVKDLRRCAEVEFSNRLLREAVDVAPALRLQIEVRLAVEISGRDDPLKGMSDGAEITFVRFSVAEQEREVAYAEAEIISGEAEDVEARLAEGECSVARLARSCRPPDRRRRERVFHSLQYRKPGA